ncbi:MAG: tripartite tricarboxylate transporter substrate binding protein [Pseudomonadota bacterium]
MTLVVAFAPGGASDALARLVAQAASKKLGQPIIVDNRAGGGGTLAARGVVRAPANGYTLMLGSPGSMIINPLLQPNLPYATASFTPVAPLARINYALMVRDGVDARSVKDLVNLSKSLPNGLTVGSAGVGSNTHLVAMSFIARTGAKLRHIPYKGTSPAMSDLMAGNIDVLFDSVPVVLPQVQNRKFRVLAVTGANRDSVMPKTPTVAESGWAGFAAANWFGIFAPPHTPAPIIEKLSAAFAASLEEPDTRSRLEASGNRPVIGTPNDLEQLLQTETTAYRNLIRDAKITLDE